MVKKTKKQADDVSIEDELAAITTCMDAIWKLNNYKAESRVLRYLMDRHKGEYKREFNE